MKPSLTLEQLKKTIEDQIAAKNIDEAIKICNEFILLYPSEPWLYVCCGDLHSHQDNKNLALKAYLKSIKLIMDRITLTVKNFTLPSATEKHDNESLMRNIDQLTVDETVLLSLFIKVSTLYISLSNLDDATAMCEKAKKCGLLNDRLFLNMAIIAGKKGKINEALENYALALDHARDRNLDDTDILFNRAITYLQMPNPRYAHAIKDCTEILKNTPYDIPALNFRAFAYNEMGEYQAAMQDCELALQYSPHDNEVICNYARALIGLKKYHEAIRICMAAVSYDPAFFHVHYYCAKAFYNAKNFLGAIKSCKQALQIKPECLVAKNLYYRAVLMQINTEGLNSINNDESTQIDTTVLINAYLYYFDYVQDFIDDEPKKCYFSFIQTHPQNTSQYTYSQTIFDRVELFKELLSELKLMLKSKNNVEAKFKINYYYALLHAKCIYTFRASLIRQNKSDAEKDKIRIAIATSLFIDIITKIKIDNLAPSPRQNGNCGVQILYTDKNSQTQSVNINNINMGLMIDSIVGLSELLIQNDFVVTLIMNLDEKCKKLFITRLMFAINSLDIKDRGLECSRLADHLKNNPEKNLYTCLNIPLELHPHATRKARNC